MTEPTEDAVNAHLEWVWKLESSVRNLNFFLTDAELRLDSVTNDDQLDVNYQIGYVAAMFRSLAKDTRELIELVRDMPL